MTLFYNKRVGIIKAAFSNDGQTISRTFPEEAQDYELIWEEIELPYDIDILHNMDKYRVNVITKQIEMLPIVNKYPTAQI